MDYMAGGLEIITVYFNVPHTTYPFRPLNSLTKNIPTLSFKILNTSQLPTPTSLPPSSSPTSSTPHPSP
jgi:hypothetical protein